MVHIQNGILLSHKRDAFESVLMKWMNLEPLIQNEVSQKQNNKYHILIYIYIYIERERERERKRERESLKRLY